MLLRYLPWIILLVSFCIPAVIYNSLSQDVLIARSVFGGSAVIGPKTLFTIFRVPLIEIICALGIEVMRRRAVRSDLQPSYRIAWQILLIAVAFKSLAQSLEMAAPQEFASVFYYSSLAAVAFGIAGAFLTGKNALLTFDRADWKLSTREQVTLAGLLLGYIAVAIIPIVVYR